MGITSLYIHTPFCRSKCRYCDFASYAGKEELAGEYFSCLTDEIRQSSHRGKKISTIFFGGGTPSLVSERYIAGVLDEISRNFSVDENCEITIETNPGTLSRQKLDSYRLCGINRISVGMQCHDDRILKILGRIHTFGDVVKSVEMINQACFTNYNLDIMCALPTQRLKDLEKTLEEAVKLSPSHISAYSLIIEEGTPFYDMRDSLLLASEEEERQMYHLCREYLLSFGYERYEVSNYAKKGSICRHNKYCWEHEDYIGFGCAAHSFVSPARWENTRSVEEYIKKIRCGDSPAVYTETLTATQLREEYIMLALRTTDGINLARLRDKYGYDLLSDKASQTDLLRKTGYIETDDTHLRISTKGFDVSDSITLKLI